VGDKKKKRNKKKKNKAKTQGLPLLHMGGLITVVCGMAPGTDWVDPLDPTVIAENELLSAANSIEAAAKKLAQLQPRLRPRVCLSVLLLC